MIRTLTTIATILAIAIGLFVSGFVFANHQNRSLKVSPEPQVGWTAFTVGQALLSVLDRFRALSVPGELYIWEQASGYLTAQAMYVAAKLNLAEHLIKEDGTKVFLSVDELASHYPLKNVDFFRRIVRYLESVLILYREGDKYTLTKIGELLWEQHPRSTRAMVIALNEEHYLAPSKLYSSLFEENKNAFQLYYPKYDTIWQYFDDYPETSRIFDLYMHSISQRVSEVAVQDYANWHNFTSIIDIGGGQGFLIYEIIQNTIDNHPSAITSETSYAVFDRPSVTESDHVKSFLEQRKTHFTASLNTKNSLNIDLLSGDFFTAVPTGFECYILKIVIHDWSDQESITILSNIHTAMKQSKDTLKNPKLLIMENVIMSDDTLDAMRLVQLKIDLVMMTMTNGKERTVTEYSRLLLKSGFKLDRVIPSRSTFSIIEASPIF